MDTNADQSRDVEHIPRVLSDGVVLTRHEEHTVAISVQRFVAHARIRCAGTRELRGSHHLTRPEGNEQLAPRDVFRVSCYDQSRAVCSDLK